MTTKTDQPTEPPEATQQSIVRHPLQEWFNENMPDESKLRYAKGAIDQIIWVRDVVHIMFLNSMVDKSEMDWDEAKATLTVDGTHTSKSVLLPVYRIDIKGHSFKIRANFHNWCVRYSHELKSPFPEWMGVDMQESKPHNIYFEGMEDRGPYATSFMVWKREHLFACLWWMVNEAIEV